MPSNEILGANTVGKNALLPHLRGKAKTTNLQIDNQPGATADLYIAGETITAGNSIAIGANAKIYKSSNVDADNKHSNGVALQDATAGQTIMIKISGIYTNNSYTLAEGQDVFVGANGQISTDKPTVSSGNIVQKIGKALSPTTLNISVQRAMVFK